MHKKGMFITFEGCEGSGKSTQSKCLLETLKPILAAHSIDIIWTREPGGSLGAEQIRSILVQGDANRWEPSTEALLMYAARDDHFKKTIQPALLNGAWVICDRFADSTIAYQGHGKGVSLDFLDHLYRHTIGDTKPDKTYLLDVPVDIGLARAQARIDNMHNQHIEKQENRYEKLSTQFHQNVREGFLSIAALEPTRFLVLDATLSQDALAQHLKNDVQLLLERYIEKVA